MTGFANQWTVRLPSSSSRFQFALAGVDAARLAVLDPELLTSLWNPATCPANLLPFLAWALSVDVWDPTWPIATKRAVVAAAPVVHRMKGTRAAVERTLSAMHMSTRIKEWCEQVPPARRGTFVVTVYVNDHVYSDELSVLNARVQRNAIDAVRSSKPKSRVFDFRLGVELSGKMGAVATGQQMQVRRQSASHGHERIRRGVAGAVATSQAMMAGRHAADLGHDRIRLGQPAALAVSQAMTAHRGSGGIDDTRFGRSLPGALAASNQAVVHRGSWRLG